MKRGKPLRSDSAKLQDWQRRGVETYQNSRRNREPIPRSAIAVPKTRLSRAVSGKAPNRKPARNDGPWRRAVIALRGRVCRRCGATNDLQADHVMSRSQQGPSVVENGMMLCREPCHRLVTENKIQYEYDWLDPDQIVWLAEVGYVAYDDDGIPYGRGLRNFAERVGGNRRVETHE